MNQTILKNSLILICSLSLLSFICPYLAELQAFPAPNYNFTISEGDTEQKQTKFVWFRVAKVGTRSILALLDEAHIKTTHVSGKKYDAQKYKNYYKFAFVRNPWDRIVSCYFNKIVPCCHPPFKECYGKDFNYFINFIARQDLNKADIHIRLQTKLFPVKELDYLGKLENFSDDLNRIFKKLGLASIDIPHYNSSVHAHYSCYYNDYTQRIIATKYKKDIKALRYKFQKQLFKLMPFAVSCRVTGNRLNRFYYKLIQPILI